MSQNYVPSISDASEAAARRVALAVFIISLLLCAAAVWYYAVRDLLLSHYDARGHLVVARRVTDSLTPGWRQLGALWLPLPHLLNAVPAMWDWAYQTGATAVAMSVISLSFGAALLGRYLFLRTSSVPAAFVVPLVAVANPNVLYLAATPMTEPLLLGLAFASLALVDEWLRHDTERTAARAGLALTALVLTRYEGWMVAGSILLLATLLRPRASGGLRWLWIPPVAAVAAFLMLGWLGTGVWPLAGNFFIPDPELLGQPATILEKVRVAARELLGGPLVWIAIAGLGLTLLTSFRDPARLLPFALIASAALPLLAFHEGHPFRVRYLIPMAVGAVVLCAPVLAAMTRRIQPLAAAAFAMLVLWTNPPLSAGAPMVLEAQWETPYRLERSKVTAALLRQQDESPILASMSSLGHYMHETADSGIPLRRFLHEGNGDLWTDAVKSPRRSVRWMLIEERAEGGDELARRARSDPAFLEKFERVIEAGGLALYRRTN